MDFDYRLKAPFCAVVSGASQSGKSTLTVNILERRKEIIDPPIDDVIWCYSEPQPKLFAELRDKVPGIEFHQGIPDDIAEECNTRHRLVVCDDLMTEMSKSGEAVNLFIRGSHHRKISILVLIQNLFYKNMRTLTLNSKYIILMRNVRETNSALVLGRQMNGNKKNGAFEYAWGEVMKKKYGYLVIDYDANQNDSCRLRDSLFPEEMIVYKSN